VLEKYASQHSLNDREGYLPQVANSYHKGNTHSTQAQPADELFVHIDTFIRSCRSPAILEYGEETMPLRAGEFALEVRSNKLWVDVWHDNRSLSRRIISLEEQATGVLDCAIHRFGGMPGKISFLDLDRPQTAHRTLTGSRRTFGEQFRRMLHRQFPGWELRSLSAAMDLQRSFSPLFPRARLTRGQHQIAAMACPEAVHEPAFLTFGVLWFAYLRERAASNNLSTKLHLFLPEGAGSLTAHRLHWMTGRELGAKLFLFNADGAAGEVDPKDLGNLDTAVKSRYQSPQLLPEMQELLQTLALRHGVGICPELNGYIGVRFRGIEFARIEEGRLYLGLESKQEIAPGNLAHVEQFAEQLALVAPELTSQPERWLESAVRSHITALDPTLRPVPVHSQVLSMSGRDRNAIDLLAVSYSGRLTVIELKTTEDIHLPMQALDYWIRVTWHAQRGELDHLFPGVPLLPDPPRLLLAGPAISFHSANQTVLRHFSPVIDVERIGINSDWHTNLKVVLRLNRGDLPQSQQSSYERSKLIPHQESNRQSES
jgi:hypothetical protein